MRIASYIVQSNSEHSLEKSSVLTERLDMWAGERPGFSGREEPSVIVELGNSGSRYKADGSRLAQGVSSKDTAEKDTQDVKIRLLESLIYALTGKRIKLRDPEIDLNSSSAQTSSSPVSTAGAAGWGIAYDRFESYFEQEQVKFSSSGTVLTADGRKISFSMDFAMSRSYSEQSGISLRLGDAARMDPLVIAYAGASPQLSQQKYDFDLNSDGSNEQISFAVGGSGFLSLDKNGDGTINDGTELFGTKSGNGFADLRAYDVDQNGWIDEDDPVFGMLSVFTIGEDGESTLFSLGEAGVGAIYLMETSTPFEFSDGRISDGMMRTSSVFLRENGTPGTIHHIDLTI